MNETQQPLPVDLPETPNLPGAVRDTRDGITVDSNTGTVAELKAGLDALDAAIDTDEAAKPQPDREDKTGRFTSRQRRNNPVARMEEATAREATAKRERDEAKAETERLKAELATARQAPPVSQRTDVPPPQARQPQVKPPDDPEPDAADVAAYPAGEFDPKYLRDVGRWEARQEYRKQHEANEQRQKFERHVQGVEGGMSAYAKRMKEAFTEPTGLAEYLKALPPELVQLRPSQVQRLLQPDADLTAGNVIADCIVESEKPVVLTTYLKENPDLFQRLLTLHPIAVFREMGRIDERLAAAAAPTRTAPTREPVSRARPPVQRVESVPQISDDPPGDSASDAEHAAYYNRKETARRYGRG